MSLNCTQALSLVLSLGQQRKDIWFLPSREEEPGSRPEDGQDDEEAAPDGAL
jgi:hypothetical protein